eukprot:scaffold421622_cov71-Attheya_sp.AAC.1
MYPAVVPFLLASTAVSVGSLTAVPYQFKDKSLAALVPLLGFGIPPPISKQGSGLWRPVYTHSSVKNVILLVELA